MDTSFLRDSRYLQLDPENQRKVFDQTMFGLASENERFTALPPETQKLVLDDLWEQADILAETGSRPIEEPEQNAWDQNPVHMRDQGGSGIIRGAKNFTQAATGPGIDQMQLALSDIIKGDLPLEDSEYDKRQQAQIDEYFRSISKQKAMAPSTQAGVSTPLSVATSGIGMAAGLGASALSGGNIAVGSVAGGAVPAAMMYKIGKIDALRQIRDELKSKYTLTEEDWANLQHNLDAEVSKAGFFESGGEFVSDALGYAIFKVPVGKLGKPLAALIGQKAAEKIVGNTLGKLGLKAAGTVGVEVGGEATTKMGRDQAMYEAEQKLPEGTKLTPKDFDPEDNVFERALKAVKDVGPATAIQTLAVGGARGIVNYAGNRLARGGSATPTDTAPPSVSEEATANPQVTDAIIGSSPQSSLGEVKEPAVPIVLAETVDDAVEAFENEVSKPPERTVEAPKIVSEPQIQAEEQLPVVAPVAMEPTDQFVDANNMVVAPEAQPVEQPTADKNVGRVFKTDKAAAESIRQRGIEGVEPKQVDGGYIIEPAATGEAPKSVSEAEVRPEAQTPAVEPVRASVMAPEVAPEPVVRPSVETKPERVFKTEKGANASIRQRKLEGYEPVRVEGGFKIAKKAEQVGDQPESKTHSDVMNEPVQIVTDETERQRIKNSIAEGELILRTGSLNGKKRSKEYLANVQRTVDRAKTRLGPVEETTKSAGADEQAPLQSQEQLGVKEAQSPEGIIDSAGASEISGEKSGGGSVDRTMPPKKQLWEMNREEFEREAIYRGIKDGTANNPDTYWTNSRDVAKTYSTGKNGKIKIGIKSEMPSDLLWIGDDQVSPDELFARSGTGMPEVGIAESVIKMGSGITVRAEIPAGEDPHKYIVANAIREGKPVPQEVLDEYPDLAKPFGSQTQKSEPQTGLGVTGEPQSKTKGKWEKSPTRPGTYRFMTDEGFGGYVVDMRAATDGKNKDKLRFVTSNGEAFKTLVSAKKREEEISNERTAKRNNKNEQEQVGTSTPKNEEFSSPAPTKTKTKEQPETKEPESVGQKELKTEEAIKKEPFDKIKKADLAAKAKGFYSSGDLDITQYMVVVELLSRDDIDAVQKIVSMVEKNNQDNSAQRTLGEVKKTKARGKGNLDRLIQLLGAQMYKGNLADVTVKEIFQNSFDAVKATLNSGVESTGKIDIIFDTENRTIAFRDNGQGMNLKTIKDAFLTLGGTDKSGLKSGESSGGLGMAKAAFMIGNEWIYVTTAKGGKRYTLKADGSKIFSKDIEIEEQEVDKNEHGTLIVVKVPRTVDVEGRQQDVYFPYYDGAVSFFDKPLLHKNVEVNTLFTSFYSDEDASRLFDPRSDIWDSYDFKTVPIGKNFDLSDYAPPLEAKFNWGSAKIYIGKKRAASKYSAKHSTLSAGLFQFNDRLEKGFGEPIPYNVIIDVFPTVKAEAVSYPFDLKREGWKSTIEEDVKSLKKYIISISLGIDAKNTVDVFKNIVSLPKVDVDNVGSTNIDVTEFIKPKKQPDTVQPLYIPTEVVVSGGTVTGKNEFGKQVEYVNLEKEKNKEKVGKSFNPEKEAPQAKDFLIKMGVDDSAPIFHNNTNVDYLDIAKKNGYSAETFFAEIGAVMLNMRDIIAEKGGYMMRKLSEEGQSSFVGISIDKAYHGVNIEIPFRGIFLNPLAVKSKTLPGLTWGYYDTIVHEFVHVGVRSHSEDFVIALHDLHAKLAEDGTDIEMRMAVSRVCKKHQALINLLRDEYESSTTRNVAKSIHEGEGDSQGSAQRVTPESGRDYEEYGANEPDFILGKRGSSQRENIQHGKGSNQGGENRAGVGGGNTKDPENVKPSDIVKAQNDFNGGIIDTIKDYGKVLLPAKLTKTGKQDLNRIRDLILRTPAFFAKKIHAVKAIFDASQKRVDRFWNLLNEMEDSNINGEVVNTLKQLDAVKKLSEDGYNAVGKYLTDADKNDTGFRIKIGEDDKWAVVNPKGTTIQSFESRIEKGRDVGEDAAIEYMLDAEGEALTEKGFTKDQLLAVRAFRMSTNKGFDLSLSNLKRVIALHEKSGTEMPTIKVMGDDGKMKAVTIREVINIMGERRGTYFPRIRKPGTYILTAKKEGKDNILEKFSLLGGGLMNKRADELRREGWTVETSKEQRVGEDVFQLNGDLIKTQQLLDAAVARVERGDFSDKDLEAEMLHMITTAVTEQVAEVVRERGARVHMNRRSKEYWAGYEMDPKIAISSYIRGMAAGEAKREMTSRMMKALTGTEVTWDRYQDIAQYDGDYESWIDENQNEQDADLVTEEMFDAINDPEWAETIGNATLDLEEMIKTETDKEMIATLKKDLSEKKQALYKRYNDFVKAQKIDNREQPVAFEWAKAYIAENTRNQEAVDRIIGTLRGIAVGKYLAFRVFAAPLTNLTSLPTSTIATMKAAGIPYRKTYSLLTQGVADYGKYRLGRLKGDAAKVYDHIHKNGWDNAQYNSEAMSTLRSAVGKKYDWIIEWGMKTFSESERLNRAATIAATYHGLEAKYGDEKSFEELMDMANETSKQAHGIYNKGDLPFFALGKHPAAHLARMFYVFKKFSHVYLQNMARMGLEEKDYGAVAHMLISPAILAGAGASVAMPIASMILKAFGWDEPEEEMYRKVGSVWGDNAERFARFGASGMAGPLGVSLKGSLQMDIGDSLFGAPGSVLKDTWEAMKYLSRGDISKGVEKALPTGLASPFKATREYTEGLTTKSNAPLFYGKEQARPNLMEAFLRGMSLNPVGIATIREKQSKEYEVKEKYRNWSTDIYAKAKRMKLRGRIDQEKMAELLGEITKYNEGAVRWGLSPITKKSIKKNLKRNFKASRFERERSERNN